MENELSSATKVNCDIKTILNISQTQDILAEKN